MMQKRMSSRPLVRAMMLAVSMTLPGIALPAGDEFNLPSLGDTSSSIMSRQQEYQLFQPKHQEPKQNMALTLKV